MLEEILAWPPPSPVVRIAGVAIVVVESGLTALAQRASPKGILGPGGFVKRAHRA